MRSRTPLALTALLALACQPKNEPPTDTPKPSAQAQAQRAQRPAWVDQAQQRLNELDQQATALEKRAAEVPADVRQRYDETVKDLRRNADELRRELREAQQSSNTDWERVRQRVNDDFRDMAKDLDEAGAKLGDNVNRYFDDTRRTIGGWLQEAGQKLQD
jgi:small-conductance mechanosensitive channel